MTINGSCTKMSKVAIIALVSCYTTEVISSQGYSLPSTVESYPTCGSVRFKVKCEDCKTTGLRLHYCNRALCRVCGVVWARKAANRIRDKIWSAHLQKHPRLVPRHIVLSVPTTLYHLPYNGLLERGLALIKSLGGLGGCYIGHPWRFVDSNGQSVEWRHCSLNPNALDPIIESFARYSPHLHFIMWGYLQSSDEVFKQTGWVYRMIDPLPTCEDVFSCAYYQLTHCGIHSRHYATRWWGITAYNNFVCTFKEQVLEQQFCSECGGRLWVLDPDTGEPYKLHSLEITRRHFKFKQFQKRLVPKSRPQRRGMVDIRHKGTKYQCHALLD